MSGLIPSRETCGNGSSNSNYFVRVSTNGNSEIIGDLTVGGTLFVDTIEPVSTTEPVYIKAPNEIGGSTVNTSALVVEGGANRIADGSGLQVSLALYKPFTRGTVNHTTGEDVGTFASWGKDTSDNDVRYGAIFINTTDPRPTNKQGRMNFSIQTNNALSAMLQIDGSQNAVKVLNNAQLQLVDAAGTTTRNIYPGVVKICEIGAITKQTSATLVPESAFTIPTGLTGYWSYTAQMAMGTVGTVADGDIFTLYADVSGGSLVPLTGTINIVDIAENSSNAIFAALSGIVMVRLTAGEIIQFYHSESGTYTFSDGSIRVAYTYLGDTAL
jgi:hypothetical protein